MECMMSPALKDVVAVYCDQRNLAPITDSRIYGASSGLILMGKDVNKGHHIDLS